MYCARNGLHGYGFSWWIAWAVYFIVVPGIIMQVLIGRRAARVFRRCAECGYDLTKNESGVCPECGVEIDGQSTVKTSTVKIGAEAKD